jgi:phosphoethanolamine N-methyltransferase
VDFRVADVTQLTLTPGSYDVVFSNWLLMYLSDEEVYNLACAAISWVSWWREVALTRVCG